MNLTIKRMTNDDIPFIHHVFEQNLEILHGNYISLEEWTEYFTNGKADPHESHHIVFADNIPAAWLKINGWNKPEVCISMLVVDKMFQHKGVGRFAIQFAEEHARYWAKSGIYIQTTKDNVIATGFYLKCGYEIIRDEDKLEFKKILLPEALTEGAVKKVVSKMLETNITGVSYQTEQLHGGTVGDIRLITGIANENLPFKIVLKVQRKWERYGDPNSWRREYDLYKSDFALFFTDSLRWAKCYYAEMNADETETQLWLEYIDGVSGYDLTVEMFERISYEMGKFQGKLYVEKPSSITNLTNLSKVDDLKDYYFHCRSWKEPYDYIRSDDCEIPEHLCKMLIEIDDNSDDVWNRIEKLPVVLCHRDLWVTNIFYRNNEIVLIDWDTSGWGYMGEDIKQLITDEIDPDYIVEYYRKCVPAYYKGFSEYADISHISDNCIREMIVINLGYRLVDNYMNSKSPEDKSAQIKTLQKIYQLF